MASVDVDRLAELLVQASEASKPLEKEDKYSAQELQEAVAELLDDKGVEEVGQIVAEVVFKKIADEAPKRDLTDILMPYGGMYSLTESPVFERTGEPVLYWLGDENTNMELFSTRVGTESFTMTFASIYVRFDFNIDLLAAGKFGNLQDHINKARNQFVAAGNMLMWNALLAAVPSGAGYSDGALTWDGMSALCDYVEDESDEGVSAILGRQTTLTSMNNWLSSGDPGGGHTLFSDTMKDEIWRNKSLTTFRGAPIVPLPKQKVNASPSKQLNAGFSGIDAIPKGDVIFVPRDLFGQFCEQGPLAVQKSSDAGKRTLTYSGGRRMGTVVFDANKIGRHHIT